MGRLRDDDDFRQAEITQAFFNVFALDLARQTLVVVAFSDLPVLLPVVYQTLNNLVCCFFLHDMSSQFFFADWVILSTHIFVVLTSAFNFLQCCRGEMCV